MPLGCTTSAEPKGDKAVKREIGVVKFDKPCKLSFHLLMSSFHRQRSSIRLSQGWTRTRITVNDHIGWERWMRVYAYPT